MSEHKMPEPVAWRCNWRKSGEIEWVQYHDETDPLPGTWDARPNETLPLYSAETVQALQAEVERLRAERDALAQDAARLDWLSANGYAVRGRGNGKRNLLLWLDTAIAPGYPTSARTAIDAAMKASA